MPIRQNRPYEHKKSKRNLTSTIAHAQSKSPSLRTTIPYEIIEMLDWNAGDILSWTIEKNGDAKYIIKVRRLE